MHKIIIMYFIIINIYTYVLFFVDKQKAKKEKRRISEYTLLKHSLMGGVLGAILAMKKFRHKTQKKEFYYRIYTIAIIYIIIIGYILYKMIEGIG